MRNALFIAVLGTLFSNGFIDQVKADEAPPASIYAIPAVSSGMQDAQPGLLPIRDGDRLSAPVLDPTGRQSALPQASVVEAIPTPTAFHAGGILLLAMFLVRCFRKLRWA